MNPTNLWRWVAISGTLAVIIGAFGAHGLKPHLSELQLESFQTGSRYHFIHTLAAAVSLLVPTANRGRYFIWAPRLLLVGTLMFSGSIYLLVCRDLLPFPVGWLGPVTPIGGVLLILGWTSLLSIKPSDQ